MPAKASLNASLTPELTAYVSGLVASGQYRSASEVVRAALRLLQREELVDVEPTKPLPNNGKLPAAGRA